MQNEQCKMNKLKLKKRIPEIMKTKTNETGKEKDSGLINKKMNRKEALQKTGYIAAATMMILLSTGKAAHASPTSIPDTAPSAPTRWSGV